MWLLTSVPTSKSAGACYNCFDWTLGDVTDLSVAFVQAGNTCQIIDQCFKVSLPCVWLQLSWAGFGNARAVNLEVSFVICICQSDLSLGKDFWQQC